MKKIKVLHISQSAGGVLEYIKMLTNNMDENKYENILIYSNQFKDEDLKSFNNIKKTYFVDMKRNLNIFKSIQNSFHIRKIIKEIKPDIVYTHSSKAGIDGRIATIFNSKILTLYNAHGWFFNFEMSDFKRKTFQTIERIFSWQTDIIVNISENELKTAKKAKLKPRKDMILINNGINFKSYDYYKNNPEKKEEVRKKIRTKLNIKEDEVAVCLVGRIAQQKDPKTFLKANLNLIKHGKKIKIVFIGDGEESYKKEVFDILKNENIKNIEKQIIVTGWIPNVSEYLMGMDIGVLPSRWEGFGFALVEYIAAMLPVIATNKDSFPQILQNGKYGELFEVGDYKELSNKIKKVEEKIKYDKKSLNLNENFDYVKRNFNIKEVVKQHDLLFEKNKKRNKK